MSAGVQVYNADNVVTYVAIAELENLLANESLPVYCEHMNAAVEIGQPRFHPLIFRAVESPTKETMRWFSRAVVRLRMREAIPRLKVAASGADDLTRAILDGAIIYLERADHGLSLIDSHHSHTTFILATLDSIKTFDPDDLELAIASLEFVAASLSTKPLPKKLSTFLGSEAANAIGGVCRGLQQLPCSEADEQRIAAAVFLIRHSDAFRKLDRDLKVEIDEISQRVDR